MKNPSAMSSVTIPAPVESNRGVLFVQFTWAVWHCDRRSGNPRNGNAPNSRPATTSFGSSSSTDPREGRIRWLRRTNRWDIRTKRTSAIVVNRVVGFSGERAPDGLHRRRRVGKRLSVLLTVAVCVAACTRGGDQWPSTSSPAGTAASGSLDDDRGARSDVLLAAVPGDGPGPGSTHPRGEPLRYSPERCGPQTACSGVGGPV